ncbi:hypothetical protein OVN42_10925, partial [Streptococcus pneumoniae]|nr:hypothetical protein [Streptococcus pneumoniae]
RLRSHPERGRRLFLLEGLGDGAIAHLYRSATVLLFLSKGGLPIICSDIAVFREIAGAHATYADISGPERLADGIVQWLGMAAQGRAPQSAGVRV